MKLKRIVGRTVIGVVLLVAGLSAASLMTSRFETTENGAHKNLM